VAKMAIRNACRIFNWEMCNCNAVYPNFGNKSRLCALNDLRFLAVRFLRCDLFSSVGSRTHIFDLSFTALAPVSQDV
jgi:hypothetical protein